MGERGGDVHDQRGFAGALQPQGPAASGIDVLQDFVREMGMDDMVVA